MTHPLPPMPSRGKRMDEKPPSRRERAAALQDIPPRSGSFRGRTEAGISLDAPIWTLLSGRCYLDAAILRVAKGRYWQVVHRERKRYR